MDTFNYTGVGSRITSEEICKVFTYLASEIATRGGRLRSGHADGPDMAFEHGSPLRLGDGSGYNAPLGREVYLPWKKFNGRRKHYDPFGPETDQDNDDEGYYVPDGHWPTYAKAEQIAHSVIPWWDKIKPSHRRMHTRNVYEVLGLDLQQPSRVLICNASLDGKGEPKGGTRTAIKVAEQHAVPVYNRQKYESDDTFIEAVLEFLVKYHEFEATKASALLKKSTTPNQKEPNHGTSIDHRTIGTQPGHTDPVPNDNPSARDDRTEPDAGASSALVVTPDAPATTGQTHP